MTPSDLTERQRQVVELVLQKWTGPQIAEQLGCAVGTVYTHVFVVARDIRLAHPDLLERYPGRTARKLIRLWYRETCHVEQAA